MGNRHRPWVLPVKAISRWPWLLSCLQLLLLIPGCLYVSELVLQRANRLGRGCVPSQLTRGIEAMGPKIAMVSLSEDRGGERRSYDGLMQITRRNKEVYAYSKGYAFIDTSDLVDPSRPVSWSKILAVKAYIRSYEWIFWNDADTMVTNSSISLESILLTLLQNRRLKSPPDLVLTEDVTGVNAGAFFVRRSDWSINFMDSWWNQTSFIHFGSSKSGDNDALKHLLSAMPSHELHEHVLISPKQCLFNSYPWHPSWKNFYRLLKFPFSTWKGTYSNGDFLVHLAGLDDKRSWAIKILGEVRAST